MNDKTRVLVVLDAETYKLLDVVRRHAGPSVLSKSDAVRTAIRCMGRMLAERQEVPDMGVQPEPEQPESDRHGFDQPAPGQLGSEQLAPDQPAPHPC